VEALAAPLGDPGGGPRRKQHPLDMHVLEAGIVERLANHLLDRDRRRATGVGRADQDTRRVRRDAADDAEVGDGQDGDFGIGDSFEHGHDRRFVDAHFFCDPTHDAILHPFERQRDALADADAHRRERALAAGPLQFLGGG
jgi:hypothetical protein